MGELTNEPLNCLLCLKSIEIRKPLKWEDNDLIDGIPKIGNSSINSQLSVIFLLRKLLKIPLEICVDLLQSYGDPSFWIACCDSCSSFVEKGRQIFVQIVVLQKELEAVQDDLKLSILNSGELILSSFNATQGVAGIVRSYIKNELNEEIVPGENSSSKMEGDQTQTKLYNNPYDSFSWQTEDKLDIISGKDITTVKIDPGMVAVVENESDYSESLSNGEEYNPPVEVITGDLEIPSEDSDGVSPPNAVPAARRVKNPKAKRISTNCDICGQGFQSTKVLRRHKLIHTGESTYECYICEERFTLSDDLKMHIVTHRGENSFKCNTCGKTFLRSYNLKNHIMLNPTGKCHFPCEICGKIFFSSGNLKAHILTHTGEKNFRCEICDKVFTLAGTLKKHLLIHSREKPFECDTCGKTFSRSRNLRDHIMVIHTGESPFACGICGKVFSNSRNLNYHLLIHTGEKNFKCEICEKVFALAGNLKKHLFIHSGEKPFKCEICKKRFSQVNNLRAHIRTHTGEKPFTCELCGKTFSQGSALKTHKKIHIEQSFCP